MLTRPLALNDSDDRGQGLVAVTSHPAPPVTDDDETRTGAFSPPAPPWSSSSSSLSSPPCASSSSSAPSPTPPSSSSSLLTPPPAPTSPPPPLSPTSSSTVPVSLLSPPGSSLCSPPSVAPSLLSTVSSTPPVPPVCFTPCSPPISDFSSSSAPPVTPSLLPSAPPPPASPFVSSTPFIYSPHLLAPSSPPSSPPLSSSSSTPPVSNILALSSVSFPNSSHFFPPSSSSPPVPPLHHVPPSYTPPPPSVSASPAPPLFFSCTPHTSTTCPPLSSSSSSSSVPPSLLCPPPPPPFSHSPTAPSLLLPPAPPPPCCPCASLLPRLLSAHRLEVRRLLRGALASLGRRLDSLERRSRSRMRKKRGKQRGQEGAGAACSSGSAVFSLSSASSCRLAHLTPVTSSSSSSDSEDSPTLPSSLSQLGQRRKRSREKKEELGQGGGKRRRKSHRRTEIDAPPENEAEKEDAGRFVGRMAVSFRAGVEAGEAQLTLHNFDHRKHSGRDGGGTGQSEKAISVIRPNGVRAPLLLHSSSSSLPHSSRMPLLQSFKGQTGSQSEALSFSSGQWRFSDSYIPLNCSSSHNAFHHWLCSSSSFSPALMVRLSAVAMALMSESMRGGACGTPLWPLKDWTAPPSLSSDHCYMQTPSPSPNFSPRRQLKQWSNHSTRSFHLPRRRSLPLPPCSANGLSAVLPTGLSAADSELLKTNGERGKRVSQIRIRRAPPRETSLTPMGLPKVKRLKKKEFSLEEIYTNKNYKSPSSNRSLETIFEEPREKDGALLLIGHQRRRRLLLFPDFTQPRKRKRPQGMGLPAATAPRKRAAARRCHGSSPTDDESDLDVMLVERLSALEDFLTRQGLDV